MYRRAASVAVGVGVAFGGGDKGYYSAITDSEEEARLAEAKSKAMRNT
jgi:hypothetical protein